jgi:signal transduction histidine kinase
VRINYEKISSEEIIKNAVALLKQTIDDRDAKIETITLPSIDCDPMKLQRVFYNLIENGIKYNRTENPVVTIESYPTSHAWVFCVSDNGIGISADKADEIFKMFSRLHNKSEFAGTGVGLAICKKIIELHGGEIWVEQNEAGGSRFLFTIPFKASVGAHD